MYTGVLTAAVTVVLLVLSLYALQRAVTVEPRSLLVLPFQSGWLPEEHALSRYHVRWYTATLLFLAFDIEMLFMYPWSIVVARIGTEALLEMSLFLVVLFVPIVWAWREGALRWG